MLFRSLSGEPAYYLNEPPGTGFVFAIASYDRFDYAAFSWGSRWSESRLARLGTVDPFGIVNSFVSQTLDIRSTYSFDYVQYEVRSNGHYRQYGNRYGNRFYGDDAYYRCLQYFGILADSYCRSYGIVYGTPVAIGRTVPSAPPLTARKRMTPKPLVVDPMLPEPEHLPPPGRIERGQGSRSSTKTGESMHRSGAPRPDPEVQPGFEPSVRAEPAHVQRYEPRPEPRVERPRAEAPRMEQPRVERPHVEQPRVERPHVEQPRADPPRADPSRVEQRQHVESQPSPKRDVPVRDQDIL